MNESILSKRLMKVVEQIPIGSSLADIGSDHAYLPCYAFKQKLIKSAVAGEVNPGPYQSALDQVRKLEFQSYISVRKGNGLEVIEPNEVDVITIAGMGGPLIATILEEGRNKLEGVQRLILQPNVAANQVRVWLEKNKWVLINEEILEEDGVIYEVLTAERFGSSPYSKENYDLEILLGPFLLKRKDLVWRKKWQNELSAWNKIIDQFDKAKESENITLKKQELQKKITQVEEVLR